MKTAAQSIRDEYQIDASGRITDPGKFEGQPIFVPHFWRLAMEGFADSDDGSVFTFEINADDLKEWPELKKWMGRKRTLKLREDSQGFVSCF